MLETLLTWENGAALAALTTLEIVLGIDNIVLLAILSGKLPEHRQASARRVGLVLAMVMRLVLLGGISWVMGLTRPWFGLFGHEFTGKSLVLLLGGVFLIYKATREIHKELETDEGEATRARARANFAGVIAQVVVMDMVFSLDSVITAVGMVKTDETNPHGFWVMAAAIVIAVGVMLWFAGPIARFIHRHPTTKMLALAFMLLIGVVLVSDGLGHHIERAYIYSAMAFSLFVEALNLRRRGRAAAEAADAEP